MIKMSICGYKHPSGNEIKVIKFSFNTREEMLKYYDEECTIKQYISFVDEKAYYMDISWCSKNTLDKLILRLKDAGFDTFDNVSGFGVMKRKK